MFAIANTTGNADVWHPSGSKAERYTTNHEVLFVWEGATFEPVPGHMIALSDTGTDEGSYFLLAREFVTLED